MENLIIVGTGTNGRHVYEFVRMYGLFNVIGFAVNEEFLNEKEFKGLPVYSLERLKDTVDKPFKVFVALLWNKLNRDRRNLFEWCDSQGFEFVNLISPHSILRIGSVIGRNCWIHDFAVIQNDTVIGDDVAIMAYTLIGANCSVGSHCFFGARSLLGGGSSIGEQCFVGINTTIFDGTTIGEKCIIGACTTVKRNLPSFSSVKTLSDNVMIKQYPEEEIENKLLFKKNVR